MRFEKFELERWLSESRFRCDVDLSASVITHMRFNDLISEKDLDMPIRIGPTNGFDALREEISKLYSGFVDAESVLVTHGAAEANFLLLNHLIKPGDKCVFFVPNYMQTYGILEAIGAKVKLCYLNEKNNYRPDLEKIKDLSEGNTKAICLTNPNNPVGVRMTANEIRSICEIAQDSDSYVIADEVLSGLELDGRQTPSVIELYEKGISTRSLSKLGLSGLRVGWIAARDATIASRCWAIRDYTSLGSSYLNQYVALQALKNIEKIIVRDRGILLDRVETLMDVIDGNREFLGCRKPEAGSTALIRYKANLDSTSYCRRLAEEEGVAVSPGDFFKAPKSFRLLYGTDSNRLKEGLTRIAKFARTQSKF